MHEVRKEEYMKKFHHYIDMNPYYRVSKLFHKGIRPIADPDEYFLVEVDKDNADLRYKYKRFEKGADRHLYDAEPRQIKYIIGNKFILEGNDVNLGRELDERGEEINVWVTGIAHPPENRQPDGRWRGAIVFVKKPMKDIRWKGLYDKNSDIQYAPRQLIPKTYYEEHFARREEDRVNKFRKMLDGAKKKLVFKFFSQLKKI